MWKDSFRTPKFIRSYLTCSKDDQTKPSFYSTAGKGGIFDQNIPINNLLFT